MVRCGGGAIRWDQSPAIRRSAATSSTRWRPAHRIVLDGLAVAHDAFRRRLEEIDARLGAREFGDAERAIGVFGEAFAAHEATEEQLLARIDAELSATASDG